MGHGTVSSATVYFIWYWSMTYLVLVPRTVMANGKDEVQCTV